MLIFLIFDNYSMYRFCYFLLGFLLIRCVNNEVKPEFLDDDSYDVIIIDSFIIPNFASLRWLAMSDDASQVVLYNEEAQEVINYNFVSKSIVNTHTFGQPPYFDQLIAATFIDSAPILVTNRNIYKWDDRSVQVLTRNNYDNNIYNIPKRATAIIVDADTSLVFELSQNRPKFDVKTRDVDSVKYQGEFLTLRRFTSDSIEHIAYVPSASLLLQPLYMSRPMFDIEAAHLNWRNELGVVFSPENFIHLFTLEVDSYNYTKSIEIPIPDWRIINRHLDKVKDPNFKLFLQPRIHSIVYNKNRVVIHYMHAMTEEALVENKLYDASAYSFNQELVFRLREQRVVIYDHTTQLWHDTVLPDKIGLIKAILPEDRFIALPNSDLIESEFGQMYYIVKIEE